MRAPEFFIPASSRFAALLLAAVCGCTPQADIRTYTIPAEKERPTTERLRPLFAKGTSAPVELPEFDLPKEWRAAAGDQFSSAAFSAGPEDAAARITITRTPAAMGLEAQLNRWRGQLQLRHLSEAEWAKELESMEMGSVHAAFVTMDGEEDSIVGAIATASDLMWFFKMRGPKATVAAELDRMKAFCASIRFADEEEN